MIGSSAPPRSVRRRLSVALCAGLLVLGACTGPEPGGAPPGSRTVAEMAGSLGTDVLTSLQRGYVPNRSGEILLVPKPWNVLAQWNQGLRGPRDPRTTHATPWDYHQRVPIVLRGPGHVRSGVISNRPVTVADIAPTMAGLLGMDFDAPDAAPLREALIPPGDRPPPRLIVVVVYDGAGWNVLRRWPDAWPTLRRLAAEGTAYTNGIVGSAPPVTAPGHANIGTGAFPARHGLPENTGRLPNGELGELFFHEADPRLLEKDTVADVWDRMHGNRPWVGLVGFESWHLGMMGRGARADGGDRDASILWHREDTHLYTNEEFYSFPESVPGVERLAARLDQLDAADGERDRLWRGNDLDNDFNVPGTPAFARYMGDVTQSLLREEPIGGDDLTDLLFVELKPGDYGGHVWNMEAREQEEILLAQDDVLAELVSRLDETIGPERWVLAFTADHGQTPTPSVSGGLRIDRFKLEDLVNGHFGRPIVQAVHPDDLFLDLDAMGEAGIEVEEVARYVGDLRYRQVAPDGEDLSGLPQGTLDERVFAAALPGPYVRGLTPETLAGVGPGAHPEGDLRSVPPVARLLRR